MSIPETMQAAYIGRTGTADQIRIGPLPVPRPGATDVLVRMQATAVNHVDLFVRSGAFPTHTPFPFVIGRDLVGTVVESGMGATGFCPGDRVWCNSLGHAGRQGACAEFAVVAAERLYHLPDGVEAENAAAVLHAAGTAHIGLVRETGLRAGQTALIEGAAGGVGSAAVQMATVMGARVIATAAPEDADWCRACGAAAVFDYHAENRYEQVRQATPAGIDLWWDQSGRHHFAQCLSLLAHGATIVVTAGLRGTAPPLPVGALYTRDVTLRGFAISNAAANDLAAAAATINTMLARGQLRGRIGAIHNLTETAAAHRLLESGARRGRIVIVP